MNLSFCTIAFQRQKWGKEQVPERPVQDLLPLLAQAGYGGAELWWPHVSRLGERELGELAAQLRDLKLAVPMISPYFSFAKSDEHAAASLAEAERVIAVARRLGGRAIRCFTAGAGSKNADEAEWQRAARCLQQLADATAADGITWALETHSWNLMDTVGGTLRLLELVARPNVRIIFQPATFKEHYLVAQADLADATAHVHATNYAAGKTCALAAGELDYRVIVSRLRQHGFAGFISVEWMSDEPEAAVTREAAYLRSLLAEGR